MSEQVSPAEATTPPRREPARPGVVTAAVVLWWVLGVLLVLVALLFLLAMGVGTVDPDTGVGALLGAALVLAVLGGVTIWAVRGLGGGSRRSRRVLTVLGVVLSVAGLVQLTFLNAGGVWFVAFVAGAVLLHVPAARAFFAR